MHLSPLISLHSQSLTPSYPRSAEPPYNAPVPVCFGRPQRDLGDKGEAPQGSSKTTFERKCNNMNELQKIRPVLRTKSRGGAPTGNSNALKWGVHTAESRARRARVRTFVAHARQTIAQALSELASQER